MASYNEIDGVPSHANHWLLGTACCAASGASRAPSSATISAIDQLMSIHHIAPDLDGAARPRARRRASTSICPTALSYATLVGSGARRQGAAGRRSTWRCAGCWTLKFRAGLFEHPYADAAAAETITDNADARALALKAAQRPMVLLKNDGMLPLRLPADRKPTLAVIGPNAAVARLGGYYGQPPHTRLDPRRDQGEARRAREHRLRRGRARSPRMTTGGPTR